MFVVYLYLTWFCWLFQSNNRSAVGCCVLTLWFVSVIYFESLNQMKLILLQVLGYRYILS